MQTGNEGCISPPLLLSPAIGFQRFRPSGYGVILQLSKLIAINRPRLHEFIQSTFGRVKYATFFCLIITMIEARDSSPPPPLGRGRGFRSGTDWVPGPIWGTRTHTPRHGSQESM